MSKIRCVSFTSLSESFTARIKKRAGSGGSRAFGIIAPVCFFFPNVHTYTRTHTHTNKHTEPARARELKCHRDGTLKSISSFRKSCSNLPVARAAERFASQTIAGIERPGLRPRSFALQNRPVRVRLTKGFGNRFICSRSTGNSARAPLILY